MQLNNIAAAHGVGRIDIVENRLVGMKSRGCYETPGGTVMMKAYKALECLVLDKASLKYREQIGLEYSHVMYDGRWFTALNDSLLAGAASFAQKVTGEIVIKLYKGQATVTQRKSPNSLYSEDFATFGADDVYDQSHAEGFIRLYSLSSRIEAMNKKGIAFKNTGIE
jgi:argininosuccinate synthase